MIKYIIGFTLILSGNICFAQDAQLAKDKARAAKGDTGAMYHMAMYYYNGDGLPQDYNKAVVWLTKAAQKGHVGAMSQLGSMYEDGDGVKKDPAKAVLWLRKAAQKGDAPALNELGTMYEEGTGVKKDMKEAVKCYQKAADKGYVDAMISLSVYYLEGKDTTADKGKAVQWLQRAADKNEKMAMRYLGDFYGDSTLGDDCGKAAEWYMKAYEHGDTASMIPVGELTLDEDCSGIDRDRSARWMQALADNGDGIASYFTARFYIDGKGVAKDYGKAMDYFIKDAEIEIAKGEYQNKSVKNLFVLYDIHKLSNSKQDKLLEWLEATTRKTNDADMMAGMGYIFTNKEPATPRDYQTAMDWSVKAADKGSATGCYNIGYLYANGYGVKENDAKAFEWMQKAAQKGDLAAMNTLGDFYENGVGVPRNHAKAQEWKTKAKEADKDAE